MCCSFRATVYPCPDTPQERREMSIGVMTRLEDLKTVLNQTNEHRYRVLVSAGGGEGHGGHAKYLSIVGVGNDCENGGKRLGRVTQKCHPPGRGSDIVCFDVFSPASGGCLEERANLVDKSAQDQVDLSHIELLQSRCDAEMSNRGMLVSRGRSRSHSDGVETRHGRGRARAAID